MPGFVRPPFEVRPEPPRTVESDVPCRRCRYNVRGLSTDRRCPECGTPVGFSVRGDLLRYSDPAWVEALARGTTLVQRYVVLTIGSMVAANLTGRRGTPSGDGAAVPLLVVGAAGYAVYVTGVWLLTRPDPSGLGEDRYGTARKTIRLTLLVGVGQHAAKLATGFLHPSPAVRLALVAAGGLAGAAGVGGTFATFVYLGRLAARIPDADAVARCRTLMWGFGVPLAVLVGGGLLAGLLATGVGTSAAAGALVLLVAACGIVLLIYGWLYLRLLAALGRRFAGQADAARRTWASESSTTAS